MSKFTPNIQSNPDLKTAESLYSSGNQPQGEPPRATPNYDDRMTDDSESYQNPEAHTFERAMADGTLSDDPRSAAGIIRAVKNAVTSQPGMNPEEIEVQAESNGKVTLTGTVDTEELREMAQQIAQSCFAVTSVNNEIHILVGIDSPTIARDYAEARQSSMAAADKNLRPS